MNKIDKINTTITKWKERITWNEYFMSLAHLASSRSPCNRLHVGCILVKNKRVISMGYNGFLPNAKHISRIRDNHEQSIIHAEQNAVTDCAKRGVSCKKATVYVTHYPCIICTRILASCEVDKIYYYQDYKNDSLVKELLEDAHIKIEKLFSTTTTS